jgi:IS5 family transposase
MYYVQQWVQDEITGRLRYTGAAKRLEFQGSEVIWHVAEKRGKLKKMAEGPRRNLATQFQQVKAQIRAKV